MRSSFYLILFLLVLTIGFSKNSYSYHTLNNLFIYTFRSLQTMPVDFRVDSGTLDNAPGMPTVEAACAVWDGLSGIDAFCGTLTPIGQDITSANYDTLVSTVDGVNDIVFDEDGQILIDEFNLDPDTVLGIGLTTTNISGDIVDIRIILNGTFPSSPAADLLATTIHEMGHTWGLAHTPIGGVNTEEGPGGLDPIDPEGIPTMYPFNLPVDDAFGQTLEEDDFASAFLLYGGP